MKTYKIFIALFLSLVATNVMGETLITPENFSTLQAGTYVSLQCRDFYGGLGWHLNGAAAKSTTFSYANIYQLVAKDGGLALKNVKTGNFIGNSDNLVSDVEEANAVSFEIKNKGIEGNNLEIQDWTSQQEGTVVDNTCRFIVKGSSTFLNTNNKEGTPKYSDGKGGFSIWYVYTYTAEEVIALSGETGNYTIQEGKCYTISTSTRGSIIWDGQSNYLEGSLRVGVALDSSNPNHQFTFLKVSGSTNQYYMINVGSKKFFEDEYGSEYHKAFLNNEVGTVITLKNSDNTSYPIMIDVNDLHWNLDDIGKCKIDGWSTQNDGNCFKIMEVCDLDSATFKEIKYKLSSSLANKEIWYTSTDGQVITPNRTDVFGATILSNTYTDGKGIIKFNGSVTSIGDYAFSGCTSLNSITIPNSVTSIGDYAFRDCNLIFIIIPKYVESISSSNPFENNKNLAIIGVDTENTTFDSRNNCNAIIRKSDNTLILGCKNTVIPNSVTCIGTLAFRGCSSLTSLTIPNSVTSIGDYAFWGCSSLTSITIPNSVTSLGGYAFYECSSLTSLTIPNLVTSIRGYTFYGCHSLTSITIPDSVTSIGPSTFRECSSLASITIPNSVTNIGQIAFSGCSSLASITNLSTIPQTITSDCFSNYSATLHVYEGLKSVYQNATNWSKFTIVDDVPAVKATSIELGSSMYFCNLYGSFTPSATVSPEATIKTVTWTSSDPSVLMILDANTGQAFGFKEGVVTITATTIDGSNLSDSAIVYVGSYIPVTGITLNQTSGTLEINKTLTLTVTVLPENATAKGVKWTSSNTEIVTVSAEGVVTALAPGTATITATSIDGTNIKATCEITVPEFNVKYTDAAGQEICRYLASGDDAAINDAYKRLEVLQPIENVNVTYTRSFDSKMVNNWQGWFMPFDVDYDDLSDDYEVAQIYGVLMDKAGVPYIAFQKMTEGLVKANVPYAVRVKEAGEAVISTTTTLQQTANTNTFSVQSTANNFTFGGVYENSYLSAEYPTYALNKSGNFALMASDVYLRPFRFYMRITDREDNPYATVTTPQEVKLVVLGEDDTTGLTDLSNSSNLSNFSQPIFNLGGQKLQKLQKGINIVNGRKVLY